MFHEKPSSPSLNIISKRALQVGAILWAGLGLIAASPSPVAPAPTPSAAPNESAGAGFSGTLSANKTIDGSVILVTVKLPAGVDGKTLAGEFESIHLPFYPLTEQGPGVFQSVLGVPFNHKTGVFPIMVYSNGKSLRLPLNIIDGKYPSEKLKVPKRLVNPPQSDMARIQREQAEIGAIYQKVSEERLWRGPFVLPIESAITSVFGSKRLYNGKMKNFHGGVDLRAAEGTPIHAPAGGTVVLAKDLFFTGNTVMLDHGYGVVTIYAHMSRLDVKVGQKVSANEVLGLSGKTGRVSGPHLHWQAVIHHNKVNPLDLTKVMQ